MDDDLDFAKREAVEKYLRKHNIKDVIQGLYTELILHMPANPAGFLVESLRNKLNTVPAAVAQQPPKARKITALKNGERRGGVVAVVQGSKRDFLRKLGDGLLIDARRIFSARGAEYAEIDAIETDETVYVSDGANFIDPFSSKMVEGGMQADSEVDVPQPIPEPVFEVLDELDSAPLIPLLDEEQREKIVELVQKSALNCIDINTLLPVYMASPSRSEKGLTLDGFVAILAALVAHTPPEVGGEVAKDFLLSTFAPRFYEIFDRDNNGFMDFAEFSGGMGILCKGSREDKLKFLFDSLDVNGDGTVDKQELTKSMLAIQRMVYSFAGFDYDDADEMMGKKAANKFFKQLDTDHSGSISYDEYLQAIDGSPLAMVFDTLQSITSVEVDADLLEATHEMEKAALATPPAEEAANKPPSMPGSKHSSRPSTRPSASEAGDGPVHARGESAHFERPKSGAPAASDG